VVDFPASGAREDAVSRRLFLAVGAGMSGLVLTGCAGDAPVSGTRTPSTPAALAPDVAVATRALEEITAVRTAVLRTLRRYPASRSRLTALLAMHRAHEAALADAVPDRARSSLAPAPYVVPRRREVALSRLTTKEQQLNAALGRLAVRAQSGDFARLLASMGAAVGQHLADSA